MSALRLIGCFVTGTDTGVGKTLVAAALLHAFAARGLRTAGYKPVAAGTETIAGRRVNDDVRRLHEASSVALEDADACAYSFDTPCAPHLAAALEGRAIDRARILAGAEALSRRADLVVVEGVGGFRVPLAPGWDSADLARDLALPMVLVVGLRLGCLSHALLTAEAIAARGLAIAGWIGSVIDPAMLRIEDNAATLRHELASRYGASCLGIVPRLETPDAASAAAHLETEALARRLLPASASPSSERSEH